MRLEALPTWIPISWKANVPVIVTGSPAIGKSEMIHQIAASQSYTVPPNPTVQAVSPLLDRVYGREFTGRKVFTIHLVLKDPSDLQGVPVYDAAEGRGVWVMTGEFPASLEELNKLEAQLLDSKEASNGHAARLRFSQLEARVEAALHDQYAVLFLDEIEKASIMVMHAALGLVLDKKIGMYRLPTGVNIVAAGNRRSDMAGGNQLPSPMVSRFAHIFVDPPTVQGWMPWAETVVDGKPNIRDDIRDFLWGKEELLYTFDPKKFKGHAELQGAVYASPRTWKFGSNILDAAAEAGLDGADDETDLTESLAGVWGEGVAYEFIPWRVLFRSLPHPNMLLDGKVDKVDLRGVEQEVEVGEGDNKTTKKVRNHDKSLEFTYMRRMTKALDEDRGNYSDAQNLERAARYMAWITRDPDNVEFVVTALRDCVKVREINFIMKAKGWAGFARMGNYADTLTPGRRR